MMAVELKSLILLLILGCPRLQAMDEKQIQGMLDLERELLRNLRKYAIKLEDKISLIEESLNEYVEDIEEANKNPELYLSNPLNAFRLIRHMHQDWVSWQVYMEKPVAPDEVASLERLLPQSPRKAAYKQAAKDVHDLSQFYDYKPSDLVAKNERNSPLHLSPLDCYELGLERYEEKDYLGAAKWLSVAADNYTLSQYSKLYGLLGAPRWQVYRDQARTLLKLNRPALYEAYEKASNLNPFNIYLMDEVGQWELSSLRDPMEPIPDPIPMPTHLERKCRGDVVQEYNSICELNNWASDFLEIAPLRLEVVAEPFTILYPNSVYESELRHVERIYARCPPSDQFRLAKGVNGCSISDRYSPTMKRIRQRMLDMADTNRAWNRFFVVEFDSLEPLEIPKLFSNSTKFRKLNNIERTDVVATVIVFFRDATEGGAITMTNYDLFAQPKRGNVLVIGGEMQEKATICPNVMGSGLVMIKFMLREV